MKQIPVTVLAFATVILCLDASRADESQNQYNVLFIAVDDLRPELGCYGVEHAQSPNLDRLARQSVLFNRHYVQVATCGASRYALLTGRSPANSGVTRSNAALYRGKSALARKQLPGAQSLPELFRRSGYRTICLGKISHTPDGRAFAYNGSGDGRDEVPHAWDELPTPFGSWKRGWGIFFAYHGGRHREDGGGHRDLMEFVAERDKDLPDGLLAEAAIKKLRSLSRSGQRFFLGLGFFKPHLPFVATKQDWQALADAEVSLPASSKRIDSPYWHKSGEFYKYHFPFPKARPLPEDSMRTARRAYLACVRYVDRQVGKVLAALDEFGIAENTIVVVWGDHGWHLGEQQLWGKHTPFERATRSVLMIRAPGISKPNTRSDALVETIDLYPTLVDLCKPSFTKTEHSLDGSSLRPILTREEKSIKNVAISYWNDAVSVRSSTHRLVAKMKGDRAVRTELYDLSSNPDSTLDVADEAPEVVRGLLSQRGK